MAWTERFDDRSDAAGPNLRAAKRIVWPDGQFEMNLVGFDHIFL